jgi:hypothetical protein
MNEITESLTFVEAAKPSKHEGVGRLRVALLTPGWGSSGYYSADVCESAGTNRVFKAGTHMYINHPTATENYERPVRDLTQLAAVLAEDATWNAEEQELQAEVTTFSNWRKPIAEMAKHIGVSIRASADVEEGTADGRDGPIITNIAEALSVDFVTKAGRGGKILEVVEDAFGKGRLAAAHDLEEASANDISTALYTLVRETHRPGYAWMRDYDLATKTVYFEMSEDQKTRTYAQSFTLTDNIPTALTGEAKQVRFTSTYVPVAEAGKVTTTQESQEGTMAQIEESRLAALEEAEKRAKTLETELAAQKAINEADKAALRQEKAVTAASTIVESVFGDLNIAGHATVKAMVADKATLKEDGSLDEDAIRKIAGEAAAEIAEAAGQGKVHGVGQTADPEDDISEEAFAAGLVKIREG